MMIISSGNVEGMLMSYFSYLVIPFAPLLLMYSLMARNIQLYLIVFLTYITMFVTSTVINKIAVKKLLVVLMVILLGGCFDGYLYMNRPSVKYGGHGFKYMHGYSSTDFTDYTVYSDNSKLAVLTEESELIIENEEDMPILDGAEACYPLYAAFARAAYKDIDIIETGLRPGEKLYEELLVKSETLHKTDNDLIFIEKDEPIGMDDLQNRLQVLQAALQSNNDETMRAAMHKVVPTYKTPEEVNCKAAQSAEMQNVKKIY